MTVLAKILSKVNDKKPRGIKDASKLKDGDKIEIIQDVNGVRKSLATATIKIDAQPPDVNKPLVVSAGDDVNVLQGQMVKLDGSAVDPDNPLVRIDWTQLRPEVGPIVELTEDPNDNTNVSFMAPMLPEGVDQEVLAFQLEAENDIHEIKMDTCNVTVHRETAPPKPPAITGLPDLSKGKVLFDSSKIWANGHERTMTGHHEFDPDDPKTEVAAGGHGTPRVWYIDGKGHCKLSGGMSRVYNHSEHNGLTCLMDTFIFDQSLDNRSYEVDSRHNEGGAIANRTGGFQNHLTTTKCGGKYESYHKSYHDLGEKTYPNGRKINYGDEVRCALVTNHDGINYEEWMFIDWDHNGKYEQVFTAKYIEKENPEGALKQPLYWRFRVNGNAPKNIESWDCKFIQL